MIRVPTEEDLKLLISEIATIKQILSKERNSTLQLFSNEEAAKLLKVTTRTLQEYRDSGKLSFVQEGRKIWYRVSDIEEFLSAHHHKCFYKSKNNF